MEHTANRAVFLRDDSQIQYEWVWMRAVAFTQTETCEWVVNKTHQTFLELRCVVLMLWVCFLLLPHLSYCQTATSLTIVCLKHPSPCQNMSKLNRTNPSNAAIVSSQNKKKSQHILISLRRCLWTIHQSISHYNHLNINSAASDGWAKKKKKDLIRYKYPTFLFV